MLRCFKHCLFRIVCILFVGVGARSGEGHDVGRRLLFLSSSIDLDSLKLDSLRFNWVELSRFSPEIRREILGISGDFWETLQLHYSRTF
jgi:hypothetical protein